MQTEKSYWKYEVVAETPQCVVPCREFLELFGLKVPVLYTDVFLATVETFVELCDCIFQDNILKTLILLDLLYVCISSASYLQRSLMDSYCIVWK